jgi:hypothetical protein
MNLSKHTQEIISQIGQTIAGFYSMRLTPLQIMILVETRHAQSVLTKKQHVFANEIRANVEKIYRSHGKEPPPSKQAFWKAFDELVAKKFLYISPHKKGTSKRAVTITAASSQLFHYPASIHPYKTKQPTEN